MININSVLFLIALFLAQSSISAKNINSNAKFLSMRSSTGDKFILQNRGCALGLSDAQKATYPGETKEILDNTLFPIFTKVKTRFNMCLGKWSAEEITTDSQLGTFGCNSFPLAQGEYSILSAIVKDVPCGIPPEKQEVSVCVAFNDRGTFVIGVSGGLAVCLASSTGLGAILGDVASKIDHANFGFSKEREFANSFTLAYYENQGSIKTNEVNLKGHFYVGMGVEVPLPFLDNVKEGLSEIFALEIEGTYLIDFGNNPGETASLKLESKSFKKMAQPNNF